MSTVQVSNLHGSSRNARRISLQGTDHLNVNGGLTLGSDAMLKFPRGTTLERPSSPSAGDIRFNTDYNLLELYNGTNWVYLTQVPPQPAPIPATSSSVPFIEDGLVVHYNSNDASSLDPAGTSTFNDIASAGGANNGNITGGSVSNAGLYFDGQDKVTLSLPSSVQNNPVTFEMYCDWVAAPGAAGGYAYLVHINDDATSTGDSYFTMGIHGPDNEYYAAFNGAYNSMQSGITPQNGRFRQVVGVWDGNNQKVYVDGIERNTQSLSSVPQAYTSNISLGDDKTSNGYRDCQGTLKIFRVYDRALSAAEIDQNYQSIVGPRSDYGPSVRTNMALYLNANNSNSYPGNGTTWYDLSGNDRHVTISGNPDPTFDSVNKSIEFNGTSMYGRTANTTISDIYNITFWVYNYTTFNNTNGAMGGPANYQSLVNQGDTYMVNLGGWTSSATNEAVHIWYGQDGGTLTYTRDEEWAANNWWQMVFNWNGNSYDIWRNGVKLNTYAGGSHATLQQVSNTYLEFATSNGQTYYFYGKISQVWMYDALLTDAQVEANYEASRGGYE
tara:strand:+ start:4524 stop:6188 length:1665 start_codon:yes stop_codon:yes gene_type:complete